MLCCIDLVRDVPTFHQINNNPENFQRRGGFSRAKLPQKSKGCFKI